MDPSFLLVFQILALDESTFNACLTQEMYSWRYTYPDFDDEAELPCFDNETFPTRCLASIGVELIGRVRGDDTNPPWDEPRRAVYALLLFMARPCEFEFFWVTHAEGSMAEHVGWNALRYLSRLFLSAAGIVRRSTVPSAEFLELLEACHIVVNKEPPMSRTGSTLET